MPGTRDISPQTEFFYVNELSFITSGAGGMATESYNKHFLRKVRPFKEPYVTHRALTTHKFEIKNTFSIDRE